MFACSARVEHLKDRRCWVNRVNLTINFVDFLTLHLTHPATPLIVFTFIVHEVYIIAYVLLIYTRLDVFSSVNVFYFVVEFGLYV